MCGLQGTAVQSHVLDEQQKTPTLVGGGVNCGNQSQKKSGHETNGKPLAISAWKRNHNTRRRRKR